MLGYLRYVYAKRGEIAVAISYYLFLVTFLTAYTHPTHAVTVTIDNYDEAELELALLLISLPAAARFLLDSLRDTPKTLPLQSHPEHPARRRQPIPGSSPARAALSPSPCTSRRHRGSHTGLHTPEEGQAE